MGEKYYVKEYVRDRIQKLLKEKDMGGGKAALANLRRGAGKIPGELPDLWGVFLERMPEKWMREDGIPSREEWAVYISLTMFSIHQQGTSRPMYAEGEMFGTAVRKLVDPTVEGDEERILRRWNPLVTATDMEEVSHHLRALVQLLRAKEIPLDYGQLAEDLVFFQIPDSRTRVQLRWGQDFYRIFKEKEGEKV